MAETTDQAKQQADEARSKLVQDLNRLEYRIDSLRDWHTWYRRYPAVFLGAAFLGAVLLGFVLMPSRRRSAAR